MWCDDAKSGNTACASCEAMSIAAPSLAVSACGFAEASELGRHLLKNQRRPCKLNTTHLGVGLAGGDNNPWHRRPSGQNVVLVVGSAPFQRNEIGGGQWGHTFREMPVDAGAGCSSGAAAFSLQSTPGPNHALLAMSSVTGQTLCCAYNAPARVGCATGGGVGGRVTLPRSPPHPAPDRPGGGEGAGTVVALTGGVAQT